MLPFYYVQEMVHWPKGCNYFKSCHINCPEQLSLDLQLALNSMLQNSNSSKECCARCVLYQFMTEMRNFFRFCKHFSS